MRHAQAEDPAADDQDVARQDRSSGAGQAGAERIARVEDEGGAPVRKARPAKRLALGELEGW